MNHYFLSIITKVGQVSAPLKVLSDTPGGSRATEPHFTRDKLQQQVTVMHELGPLLLQITPACVSHFDKFYIQFVTVHFAFPGIERSMINKRKDDTTRSQLCLSPSCWKALSLQMLRNIIVNSSVFTSLNQVNEAKSRCRNTHK